jgi:hypothetical protein
MDYEKVAISKNLYRRYDKLLGRAKIIVSNKNKTKYELKYQYFSKIDENSSFSNFWVKVGMTVNLKNS